MREYFHWVPARLIRRRKTVILCAAALCADICVAAFLVLILNICTAPDLVIITRTSVIICAVIAAGLLFCFTAAAVCDKKIRRRSRYTYLDIQLKGLVYSSYAGEYRVAGRRIIVRDVYFLPFKTFSSAAIEPDGKTLVISGKLRHYCMNSENLGYHVIKGEIEFDRPHLSMRGFTNEVRLHLPAVFGDQKRVLESVLAAKKRFDELPAPKPYVFREADFIRLRPKARVLPESFDYSRNWKNQ